MTKTLVLGLGNPILSDDAVGIRVAECVQSVLPPDTDIEVKQVCVGGLTLMESMLGYERVLLADALKEPDGQPGTIRRLTLAELRSMNPTHNSTCPHDTSLVTALAIAEQMGLNVPEDVVIYGIHADNVMDFSDQLTPAVAQAVPKVVAAILAELNVPSPEPEQQPKAATVTDEGGVP